jgi:hypothetical protein
MTDIEVLLNNFRVVAYSAGGSVLMLWGLYYFFRNLFGEGGRNPVKIAVSELAITGASGVFAMIPSLISAGSNTGGQVTGGGGSYSMQAPADLTGSTADNVTHLSAA